MKYGHGAVKLWAALAIFVIPSFAQAAFVNAGFETGDLTGWIVGGNAGSVPGVGTDGFDIPGADPGFSWSRVNVRSGQYAAFGVVADQSTSGKDSILAPEFFTLTQTVNLAAGSYDIGFYLGHDQDTAIGLVTALSGSPPGGDPRLGIFIDGVHSPFTSPLPDPGTGLVPGTQPNDLWLFATTYLSTGGPATITLSIGGSGTANAGVSVDDTFVTLAVPLPGALLLMGSGLLTLVSLRRRRLT